MSYSGTDLIDLSASESDLAERICGFTGDDVAHVMADLLPIGAVWPRDPQSVQQRAIRGWAEEFARVLGRDCDLLNESYPCCATETLTDWERVAGLPNACIGELPTVQQRQRVLCALLGAIGGASEQYFYDIARALGYDIEIRLITGNPEFRADHSRAGQALEQGGWRYVWWVIIHGDEFSTTYFRAGLSKAGEPLATWGDDHVIRCLFEQLKPAHTRVIWNEPLPPAPPGMADDFFRSDVNRADDPLWRLVPAT